MNRWRLCVLVLGLAACSGEKPAGMAVNEATAPGWQYDQTLTVEATERTYALYTPAARRVNGLVIALHGSDETARDMIAQINAEFVADEHGFLLAVPQGLNNGWNDENMVGDGLPDDVGFIDALVVQLARTFPNLPTTQIFAYGFSNGGGLATRLGCESRRIRGIGVIGNYHASSVCMSRPTTYAIPGWFGAGVRDESVPVTAVRSAMASFASDMTTCSINGPLETIEAPNMPAGVVCKEFSGCTQARLCEYAEYEHEVLPGALLAMWIYLNAATMALR